MYGTDNYFNIPIGSFLIGIVIPLILYWYSTRNHSYWAKRGIPSVETYPLIGSIPAAFTKSFEETEIKRYKRFGDLYGLYEGNKPTLTVARPELIRDIMVKDFQYFSTRRDFNTGDEIFDKMLSVVNGEDWKRIRTIVSPTFTTGKIKRVTSIFKDCAMTLTQNLKMANEKGESSNVLRLYGAFAMDVIASSAFSTKIDSHNDPNNEFVKRAKAAFDGNSGFIFLLFIVMPKLLKKLGIQPFKNDNTNFFKKVTYEIIEERKKTGQAGNDFLQLLLDIATETAKEEKWEEQQSDDILTNYGEESMDHPVFNNANTKRLSMSELVGQCVIFFLAGYHTTATTLALITYQLALNQDIQDRVFQEIKEVLDETDGEFKYESVQKMKYLDNVISETLRMYSPVIRLERTAVADYKLGNTGITIPKGMIVGIPTFAMHKDPKLFPEPDKFYPDRFSGEGKAQLEPYTYLPFGTGPRNCVGMRFALMEMKVCLTYVLSAFQAQTCSETKVPVEFEKTNALLKPKSVFLRMTLRSYCPLKP